MKTTVFALIVTAAAASFAHGNSGTLLPLDQYQAGTESATLVPNGDFEAGTTGWTVTGAPTTAAHVGPNVTPSVMGTKAATFDGTSAVDRTVLAQLVSVTPNTDYVISGYVWNFGATGGFNGDLAAIEARTTTGAFVKNAAVEPTPGSIGVYGYDTFNSGSETQLSIEALFDFATAGSLGAVAAQIDNVALTPASSFVAPRLVPEPASLSLIACGLASLRRNRR